MQAIPVNWNVVVAAAWNLAILTPDGIRKRLLELDASTPIQVEVALDTPQSFRVIHDGMIIVPSSQ